MHAILNFQGEVKAEAINRGHLRLLCLDASKPFGEQEERVLGVGIHELDDVVLVLIQRIGLRFGVIWSRHPSHYSEAAHEISVQYVHSVEGKIVKIDPVLAIRVMCQIDRTRGCELWLWYSVDTPYQRNSG